jgi:hypothetical protein
MSEYASNCDAENSATGTGAVVVGDASQMNIFSGTLGGTGRVAGAVSI